MAVVRALLLPVGARAALGIFPFATLVRFASRAPADSTRPRDDAWLGRWMRWETASSRTTPALVQALVTQRMFVKSGRAAELRIGVRRDSDSSIVAHAWVESDGAVVIGSRALSDDYVPFPPIRPQAPPPTP